MFELSGFDESYPQQVLLDRVTDLPLRDEPRNLVMVADSK